MSKNLKVNNTTYNGISIIQLPLSDGSGKAQFKDVDEILLPTGSISITSNGTHDVSNYANAIVNVQTSSGGITPSGTKEITENGEHDVTNYASVNVQVSTGGSGYSVNDIASGAHTNELSGEITITAPEIVTGAFGYNKNITKVTVQGPTTVRSSAFAFSSLQELVLDGQVTCEGYIVRDAANLTTVRMLQTPKYIGQTAFNSTNNITDIYVPFGENDNITSVTNTKPWGATKATIHYNSK